MSDLSRSENLYKVSKSVVVIEDKSGRIDHSKLKELFPVNSWCIKYNLYADSQPTTYFYCIKPADKFPSSYALTATPNSVLVCYYPGNGS